MLCDDEGVRSVLIVLIVSVCAYICVCACVCLSVLSGPVKGVTVLQCDSKTNTAPTSLC